MPGAADAYVDARRALLDALVALSEQRDALVLVGAQAIYLRLGEADIAVPAFTTDADLAIDPSRLRDEPIIEETMRSAGFRLRHVGAGVTEPGIWELAGDGPTVDLLVPRSLLPMGRRGARLGIHGTRAAKTVPGLEGAIVDRDLMPIGSLETHDHRQFAVWVAGPAALLIMKAYKIADHIDAGRPIEDKDAYDVLRLLRDVPMDDLALRYRRVLDDRSAHPSAKRALELVERFFGARDRAGAEMAARAVSVLADPEETARACAILSRELLAEVGGT